jgi:hypothetical protein
MLVNVDDMDVFQAEMDELRVQGYKPVKFFARFVLAESEVANDR